MAASDSATPARRSLFDYARRVPGRKRIQVLWFDVCRVVIEFVFHVVWRLLVVGREKVPASGPVLFVSNHQSFLDPIINGIAVRDRQLTAIARQGLFKFRPFGWLMKSIGAISIREDGGADAAAMRAALGELQAGRCILIYPEGSRSPDGRTTAFQRGVMLLVRRAKVTVLPMALEGAYDVWPRTRKLPGVRGRLGILVGDPIGYDELMKDGPDAALARLEREIESLRLSLRAQMRERSGGRWPRSGLADTSGFEAHPGVLPAPEP
jgi:1-acyl-sn-glycerol-3-phosphate acyltransferase